MFEGLKFFAIWDDSVKRCNIHCENKLVFAQEIEIVKNLKCVLTVLMYDGKDLTTGGMIFSK